MTNKIFNPVWFVFIGVVIILFLSACDAKPENPHAVKASDIALPTEFETAQDWTRFFRDIYNPALACADAHKAQPAFILNATSLEKDKSLILVEGSDGSRFECVIKNKNLNIEKFVAFNGALPKTPSFRPEGSGLPLPDSCLSNILLKTKTGKNVGWISKVKC